MALQLSRDCVSATIAASSSPTAIGRAYCWRYCERGAYLKRRHIARSERGGPKAVSAATAAGVA
jgi:hypothetical protein